MKERKLRSLIKTISWRFLATITTVILVFIFTGDIKISIGIGIIEMLTKLIFYYLHERIWNNIQWGKQ